MANLERITKTVVHEVHSISPYGSGTSLIEDVITRLPKADRTLTHLERYVRKESGRDRVPGVGEITGRAHIGEIRWR